MYSLTIFLSLYFYRKKVVLKRTRASPRLAKQRLAAGVTSLEATPSVVDLEECPPGASSPGQDAVGASETITKNVTAALADASLPSSEMVEPVSLPPMGNMAARPVSSADDVSLPSIEPSGCAK